MEQQVRILRTILNQLKNREAEVRDEGDSSLSGEFLRLKRQSSQYRSEKTYPSKAANQQENVKKNRYKDIVPFDHSRVKLNLKTSKNDSDYINASFIQGASGSKAYVATQGPLPHTMLDFWRMIWEYDIQVVVMACREFEMGRKKCERYWPENKEEPFVCQPFTIYCDSVASRGDYLTRTLRVIYYGFSRTLLQLHYMNWPDHGVPDSVPPILDMLKEMRRYQPHDSTPICFHCSAGCGRTGVLCVVDYTRSLLNAQRIPENFSIYNIVQEMRTQRPSVVQTKEQYELVHGAIELLFEEYLQSFEQPSREQVAVGPSCMPTASQTLPFDHGKALESDMGQQLVLLPQMDPEAQNRPPVAEVHEQIPAQVPKFSSSDLVLSLLTKCKGEQQKPYQPELQRAPGMTNMVQIVPPNHHVPNLSDLCLKVEDPYFDSPTGSPLSEEAPITATENMAASSQWNANLVFNAASPTLDPLPAQPAESDEVVLSWGSDTPPPLPQRTPESYLLAVHTEDAEPCEDLDMLERLTVITHSNLSVKIDEQMGVQRSPMPSPVPPLPERTPESYELASEEAAVDEGIPAQSAGGQSQSGVAYERAASSPTFSPANYSWTGGESMDVRSDFIAQRIKSDRPPIAVSVLLVPIMPSSNTSSNRLSSLSPHPLTPPLSPQDCESPGPPLPERTPESFILVTEQAHVNTNPHLQSSQSLNSSHRIGTSSEWAGSSQPKRFLDGFMNRSKSVKAKSSRPVSLVAAQPTVSFATPTVEHQRAEFAQQCPQTVGSMGSLTTSSPGNREDGPSMSRSKSLKFFRHKTKSKPPAASVPTHSPPAHGTSSPVFKFGFGKRFGKPKGPRSHPETWV